MLWEERVESIKAGVVAAAAVAGVFPLTLMTNQFVLVPRFAELAGLQVSVINGAVSSAIALFAAFLFGITYRYVIRQDENDHLRSGAVLAFGLVRGLAQIDMGWTTQGNVLPSIVLAGESVVLFAIARIILDWAMVRKWVKPFSS